MSYKLLSLSHKNEWNDFLKRLPIQQQDIYYTPEYYGVYEKYGDGTAQCFVFEHKGDIAIYPFLINSINQLGYDLKEEYYDIQGVYGYNGVVASTIEDGFRGLFYQVFRKFCLDNNIIAEFTRFNPLLKNYEFSTNYLIILKNRQTIYIKLDDSYDLIWKNYSSVNRNMIRKAIKNNVRVKVSNNKQDYLSFMKIYYDNMRRINADEYYFFNKEYFLNIKEHLEKNHKLIIAEYDNEIIGGMILLMSNKYAHYHLSAQTSIGRKLSANNLYLHKAINLAKEEHCDKMHFGGGATNDESDSLLKFKANFSKTRTTFYFGTMVHNKEVYDEIITQWELKFSEKREKFDNIFLKYRF